MLFLEAYADPANPAISLAAAVFGLLIGSFLNVVIHRLPKMMLRETANFVAHERGEAMPHGDRYTLWLPRSACPHCATPLPLHHNVPVLSWLLLRGRCGECKAPIGMRYPAVELLSAALFALAGWQFGAGLTGLAVMACGAFQIALAFIDAETMLLPDDLTLPLLWLGLLVNLGHRIVPLQDAVLGAAGGYAALWLIFWIFKLASGKEGLGYGDFKLMAALGAWLGWQALPFVLLSASALGAVAGIALMLAGRHERGQVLPFGPYLAIAGMLALLFGSDWLTFGLYDY
ncbi:MAG: Type 4 prepilin-like proteins leader peptide-processing enzyme [Herbaspirillum frisingense]|uniref:Prepilin leader peptidase/N-methyltransferase n=1 Tax=Herbaspirillum frisingense TaxID=92645 RepID=A0A7V8JSB8_9BURK|nr:MAG: Type 4 prepilin-like proteins leader peptide-processing enzyme [Herbaspirillum frisingense]